MTPISPTSAVPFQASDKAPLRDVALLEAAKKLEATFLAEMLKAAGFGKTRDSFGGGEGEDQFASFLVAVAGYAATAIGRLICGDHGFHRSNIGLISPTPAIN
jgi:hypothetical protein